MAGSAASRRISARAKVVLPLPRSPVRVSMSPGSRMAAMSVAKRSSALSSGSAVAKLAAAAGIAAPGLGGGGAFGGMLGRKQAGHGGAAAERRIEAHGAAMQLHERAHQRQAEAGAAVARALRMRLEPVEDAILHLGRDAGAAVRDREHH